MTAAEMKEILSIYKVKANHTLPICNKILYTGNTMVIDDLENRIEVFVDIPALEPCLLDHEQFLKVVKNLDNDEVLSFTIDAEKRFQIKTSDGTFAIPVEIEIDEIQKFPSADNFRWEEAEGCFSKEDLANMLIASKFCGTDDLRRSLSGINITEGGEIQATDAYKLSWSKLTGDIKLPSSIIVHAKSVALLPKLCAKKVSLCELKMAYGFEGDSENATRVRFSRGGRSLNLRLIEGRYPNIHAVIPKDNQIMVQIDRLDMIKTATRAMVAADPVVKMVVLFVTPDGIKVSSRDEYLGTEYTKKMDSDFIILPDGESIMTGYKAQFLIDILKTISEDKVKITMSASNRASIITPVVDGFNMSYLLLPIILK